MQKASRQSSLVLFQAAFLIMKQNWNKKMRKIDKSWEDFLAWNHFQTVPHDQLDLLTDRYCLEPRAWVMIIFLLAFYNTKNPFEK